MRKLFFSKYSAAGNDFILIDNRNNVFPVDNCSLIRSLTERRLGIGADGIILLEHGQKCNFKMRIFNPDGSEATMCGNGLRALTCFLRELGCKEGEFLIETLSPLGPYRCSITNEGIKTEIAGKIENIQEITLETTLGVFCCYHINTGTPHSVLFFKEIDDVPVETLGNEISHHPFFSPTRTNVNFASWIENSLKLRTFEKGVEKETLACGTGAIASGIVASTLFSISSPLFIQVKSGDILTLIFKKIGKCFFDLALIGPAKQTFHGSFSV